MSKFIFRFLEEATDIPIGAAIVLFLPAVLFIHFLSGDGPGSQTAHKHTHESMHKHSFGPDFAPPPLSICGVFKYQSRVV